MKYVQFDQQVNKMKKIVGQMNTCGIDRPSKNLRDRRPRSASENRALLRAVVHKVANAKKTGLLTRINGGYALKWSE